MHNWRVRKEGCSCLITQIYCSDFHKSSIIYLLDTSVFQKKFPLPETILFDTMTEYKKSEKGGEIKDHWPKSRNTVVHRLALPLIVKKDLNITEWTTNGLEG